MNERTTNPEFNKLLETYEKFAIEHCYWTPSY